MEYINPESFMRITLVLSFDLDARHRVMYGQLIFWGLVWGDPCGIFRSSTVAAIAGFDFIKRVRAIMQ